MRKPVLYISWAALYVICTAVGGIFGARWWGYLLSAVFFVPALLLLYDGKKRCDRKQLTTLFCVAAASLSLTLILILCNLLSVTASREVGDALHIILALVSAPMLCAPSWAFSLFFWAFLLIGAIPGRKK